MHVLFVDKDGDVVVAPAANVFIECDSDGSGATATVAYYTDYTTYDISLDEFKKLTRELTGGSYVTI